MSETQVLQSYKTFVDARLTQLSTQLKSKLDLYKGTNRSDASDIVLKFFYSEEVKRFQSDAEALESTLEPRDIDLALEYKKDISRHILNKILNKENVDAYLTEKISYNEFAETLKKIKQNPPRPSSQDRSYDQVVKGDVKISEVKNNNKYSHKIKFNKIGKFLLYQVWDPTGIVQTTHLPRDPSNETHPKEFNEANAYIKENPDKVVVTTYPINDDRDVFLKTGKEWVLLFNSIKNFTPTTVMQIGYKKYVFVLKKAEVNKNNKVVFYISTKEILVNNNNNNSEKMKKLKKIPLGKYKNVRFDIDYGNSIADGVCNQGAGGYSKCYCPAGTYITTMAVNYIGYCMNDCPAGQHNYAGSCYTNCDSVYYTDACCACSQECTGDAWSVGIDCDKHGWLGIPYPAYLKHIYSIYIQGTPKSFQWGSSDGYFCNTSGQIGNTENTPSCPKIGDGHSYSYPTCWNAGNNNQSCCIPNLTASEITDPFNAMCCPPGSSC